MVLYSVLTAITVAFGLYFATVLAISPLAVKTTMIGLLIWKLI
jgi:hypothetical protein